MNILNWKINQEINTIRTLAHERWSSSVKLHHFCYQNLNAQTIYFKCQVFHLAFMFLKSTGFNFFAKTMRGNYVFCCSSYISFNPTSHLNYMRYKKWWYILSTTIFRWSMMNKHVNNMWWQIMLKNKLVLEKELSDINFERLKKHKYAGPFKWQNAHINNVKCAMACHVHFAFCKIS